MSKEQTTAEKARRVAHLTSAHPPFDVRIFHKECKSIARAGYDVTLIASHDRDETRDRIRLRAVPRQASRFSRMTRGVWTVYREAKRADSQLYHFHDPELIPVGLLMRLKGKKVVYDAHEDVSADVAVKHYIPSPCRRPAAWLVSLLEKSAAKFFSAVVSATPAIGRRFHFRRDRSVVVSNYPVINELQLKPQRSWAQRSASVAYVGLLARDRCVSEMVMAMDLFPKDLQVTLKLAGAFSPEELREELAGMDGWDRVDFRGTLDRSQVAEVLEEARAGLVILKPTPGYLSSAPIKMFEYMSAGIPVIASDFPSFRKIVEGLKCGLLVDPLDPRAIAQAIEYIVSHPEEAEQMGRRGHEAVKTQYNWASEERKLLDLYGALFDSPCAG